MHKIFTVGPAAIYPSVPSHIQFFLENNLGSISHRSEAFREIYTQMIFEVKNLLSIPNEYEIYIASSPSEIWERIVLNTVEHYSHHLVYGDFSKRFYTYALALKKEASMHQIEPGKSFEDPSIEIPDETELIGICQNETSTGAYISKGFIQAIRKKYPEKLIAIDIVSSVPYVDLDFSKIDMAYFSGQKGFGLPTGIGVWVISPRAIDRAMHLKSKGINMGAHHTISQFHSNYINLETPSTPNVLGVFLLGKIAHDMNLIGIEKIRRDIDIKAEILNNAISQSFSLKHFVNSEISRSKTTIAAEIIDRTILSKLELNEVIVSNGYGVFKDRHIRIGNFPACTIEQMESLASILRN